MFDLNGALERFAGKLALENILAAAVTLLVCMVAVRLLLKLARRLLCRTKLEERIRRYILMLVKLVLYTLTVVFTAGSLGVNMTSLVALLSVGSLGVTLAAEDVLGNVAGGLVILSNYFLCLCILHNLPHMELNFINPAPTMIFTECIFGIIV